MAQQYNFEESLIRIDNNLIAPLPEVAVETMPNIENLNIAQAVKTHATILRVKFKTKKKIEWPIGNPTDERSAIITFINEVINIAKGHDCCKDIIILGNTITLIYDTPLKIQLNNALDDAARIRTIAFIISQKATVKNLPSIETRISLDYGEVTLCPLDLFFNGIRTHSWFGSPIDNVESLTKERENDYIIISHKIWMNLNEHNQDLFLKVEGKEFYEGSIVNIQMSKWIEEQK